MKTGKTKKKVRLTIFVNGKAKPAWGQPCKCGCRHFNDDRCANCNAERESRGYFMTKAMYECMVQPRNYGPHIPGKLP